MLVLPVSELCANPPILFLSVSPQRVPPLHLLHGGKVPCRQLLLAQPAGGELHDPRTQALFLQLHRGAGGVARPAGRHAHRAHPHPRFPHLVHDRAGGLVQQEERSAGLGHENRRKERPQSRISSFVSVETLHRPEHFLFWLNYPEWHTEPPTPVFRILNVILLFYQH